MGNPKNKILKVNLQNHILDCRMMIDYIDYCIVSDVSETRLASIYSQLKDSLAVLSEADSLDLEDDHNYAHTLYHKKAAIMTVMKEKTNFTSSKVFWLEFNEYKKMWLRNNKINNIIE